jgi:hypothetical protein
MAITNITRNATIDEWRIQTNLSANSINRIETGYFNKSNGTFEITNTGVLSITATGTPLQVSNAAQFSTNVSIGRNLTIGVVGANTGNVEVGSRVSIQGSGIALTVANNVLIRGSANGLVVANNILSNNYTSNNIVNVGTILNVGGDANLKSNLIVKGNFTLNTNKFIVETSNGDTTISGNTNVVSYLIVQKDADLKGNLAVKDNFTVNTDKFIIQTSNGDTTIAGNTSVAKDFNINTDKFTVVASTGNTSISGKLDVTGTLSVNNKVTVDKDTGATAIAGNLTIATDKFTVNSTTGDVVVAGNTSITKDLKINTDKFVVTGTTGATAIAGDVSVNTNKFTITSATGATAIAGDVAVATNKFTINSTTGDVVVSGNTNITKDLKINTDKFVVTGTTGATAIAGDVAVATNKFTINSTTGDTTIAGNTSITKDLKINTDKFVVTGTTGATAIAGDVAVATNKFTISSATGATAIAGDVAVATNKFTINSTTGDVSVAGNTSITKDLKINTDKFVVTGTTGATAIAGDVAVATNKFTISSATGDTLISGTLNVNNKANIVSSSGDITTQGKLFVTGEANVNNKVVITAATGDTSIAGKLFVTGEANVNNKVVIASDTGNITTQGKLFVTGEANVNNKVIITADTGAIAISGDVSVNTNKFTISSATGDTSIAGNTNITKDLKINTDKFSVTGTTGATAIAGDVAITSATASSSTTTGALKVKGGISSEASVYAAAIYDNGARVARSASGTAPLTLSLDSSTGVLTGSITLSSATNSTATNEAATPSAVKAAYDLAGLKVAKAGDTMTGALEITNTTGSTSTTTGALKVKGGISSEANVFSPNVTATSVLTAKDARLETAILTGGLTGTTASFSGSMSVGGSFTITGESLIDTDRIKLRGSTKQPLNVGYSYFVVNRTTIPATANPTTDKIELTSHGFTNGESITLANVSSTITGISNNTIYYVQNKTDNDFQLALTQGGGAIDFNGTSGQVRVIDNGKSDAELRWNEPSKIWEIRDVASTDGYSKILTANLISDSTSSASSDTLASSKAVKTVADSIKNPQITINGEGNGLEGTGNFTLNQDGTATITLSHKNTSDVVNVTAASDGTVLQGIKFDEFGHVAEVTTYNLDGRYYTESESDNRFINNSGDESMSGALAITKDTDSESTSTGALKVSGGVGIAKNLYVGGNVVISKNLTVSGTTTYINTTTLSVGDNIIELNADILPDAEPSENAGIEVKRGNSPASYIRWNEDGDHWVANTGLINGEYRLANTTTYLAEGSNLYFTAARVRANVSVATGSLITYNNSTGEFDIGTITAAKGGTGLTSYVAGDILYADSTTTLAKLAKGTNGQVLKLQNGLPAWVNEYSYSLPTVGVANGGTGITSYAAGDILYASAENTLAKLAKGTDGKVLKLVSGVPAWATEYSYSLPTVGVANGGTGLTSYAAGDILYSSAENTLAKLAKGTDGQVLKLVSGLPAWATEYSYSLPLATDGARGGVRIGYNTDAGNRNYAVQLSSEKMYVNVPWTDTTYSKATKAALGLVKLFSDTVQSVTATAVSSTVGRTYAVQFNGSDELVVNVPWVDTDTTYSKATKAALGLVKVVSDTTQSIANNAITSTAGKTYAVQFNGSDELVVNVPWVDTDTTYSKATKAALGLVKLVDNTVQSIANNAITSTSNRTYAVQFNGSDELVVNVPWVDTDTNLVTSVAGKTGAVTLVASDVGLGTTSTPQFGSLGIGTAASGTTGEIRATGDITAGYSDDNLKNRIGNIENALDKVSQLAGFYYTPNDLAKTLGYNDRIQVGLSAQEVQNVLPEVVVPAPIDSKFLTVQYERMIPLLVEAIKELSKEIQEIKKKL